MSKQGGETKASCAKPKPAQLASAALDTESDHEGDGWDSDSDLDDPPELLNRVEDASSSSSDEDDSHSCGRSRDDWLPESTWGKGILNAAREFEGADTELGTQHLTRSSVLWPSTHKRVEKSHSLDDNRLDSNLIHGHLVTLIACSLKLIVSFDSIEAPLFPSIDPWVTARPGMSLLANLAHEQDCSSSHIASECSHPLP